MVKLSLIKDFEKMYSKSVGYSYWNKEALILVSLFITDYASGDLEEGIIPDELYIISSDLDRIYLSKNPDATPETDPDFIIRTWDIHWDEKKPEYVSINWTFHVMGDCPDGTGRHAINSSSHSSDILVYGDLARIRLAAYKGQTVVTIPNTVVEIGDMTFDGFTQLEEVFISEGVTKIGHAAFAWCTNLKYINIPESVNQIRGDAFRGCSNLAHLHIPDAVTEIDWATFEYCSSLQEIDIPKITSIIWREAFSGCIGLTKVWIPDSVTLIEKNAFKGCSALKEISIPIGLNITEAGLDKNVRIDIRSNDGVRTIPNGVREICRDAFRNCSELKEVQIPESVTKIGSSAFEDCIGLKELFIPDSVMVIGRDAFKGCSALEKISIPIGLNVTQTGFHPNTIIDIRSNDGIRYLPYGVTEIIDKAFDFCSELKGIHIPESVTRIGKDAFIGCAALKEVRLPDNVTEIGEKAFAYCSNLTEVIIPKILLEIGKGAFDQSYFWYMTMCHQPDLWFDMCGLDEDDEEYNDYIKIVKFVKESQDESDEEMRILTIFKQYCQKLVNIHAAEGFKKFVASKFRKEWYKNYCEELDEEKFDKDGDLNIFQFTNYLTKIGHTERQERFSRFLQQYPKEVLEWLCGYSEYSVPLFYKRLAYGGDYDLFGYEAQDFFDTVYDEGDDRIGWDFNYALILEEEYGVEFAADYLVAAESLFWDVVMNEEDETQDKFTTMINGIASRCDNAALLSIAIDWVFGRKVYCVDVSEMNDDLERLSRLIRLWKEGKAKSEWIEDSLYSIFCDIIDSDPESFEYCGTEKEYVLKVLESDFAIDIKDLLVPYLEKVLENRRESWPEGVQAIEAFLNK